MSRVSARLVQGRYAETASVEFKLNAGASLVSPFLSVLNYFIDVSTDRPFRPGLTLSTQCGADSSIIHTADASCCGDARRRAFYRVS